MRAARYAWPADSELERGSLFDSFAHTFTFNVFEVIAPQEFQRLVEHESLLETVAMVTSSPDMITVDSEEPKPGAQGFAGEADRDR